MFGLGGHREMPAFLLCLYQHEHMIASLLLGRNVVRLTKGVMSVNPSGVAHLSKWDLNQVYFRRNSSINTSAGNRPPGHRVWMGLICW